MFLKRYWPGIVWGIIIVVLSGIPGNFFPEVKTFWDWTGPDKLAHLILYSVFSFLIVKGIHQQFPENWSQFKKIFISFNIGMILGGIMEIMQQYVFVGRNGNLYDFVANILGCIVGIAGFWFFRLKILNKN